MVAKVVERQMGVALWRQIADRIRLAISNGDYDATGMRGALPYRLSES